MTRWQAIKVIISMLICIGLGVALIVIGLQETKHNPYQPSPNAVTPYPYPNPNYIGD